MSQVLTLYTHTEMLCEKLHNFRYFIKQVKAIGLVAFLWMILIIKSFYDCHHLSVFSSSSSSSPLLSLVQVPAKLAINLSIHTQHTYDNGVDRTGDRVFRKIQLLHEEREEENIF